MEKLIFDEDIAEFRSGPAKFGICMATYQRRSGRTPAYLKRSLDAILSQTATNWHLYLVGDKYENNDEFLACIASFPKDKITYTNLTSAHERENMAKGNDLWKVAGSNAYNHCHKMALDDGCTYIVHHDDDDFFSNKKIQILNYTLSLHPEPICIFHYSKHMNCILPGQKVDGIKSTLETIQYLPSPCNLNHSSITIHKSIASSFKYDGFRPGKIHYECGDIQLITYIRNAVLTDPKKYTVFVPLVLCVHDVEGQG